MSKITFRADDELVEQIEDLDASKSEVMREALRTYLDDHADGETDLSDAAHETLDGVLAERVDELVTERLAARERHASTRDVNVNITLEPDAPVQASADREGGRASDATAADERRTDATADADEPASVDETENSCGQCGESLSDDHVYCPNCGEKAARRVFCECGDEVRSDWGFCPSCGRRTPAADVLDGS